MGVRAEHGDRQPRDARGAREGSRRPLRREPAAPAALGRLPPRARRDRILAGAPVAAARSTALYARRRRGDGLVDLAPGAVSDAAAAPAPAVSRVATGRPHRKMRAPGQKTWLYSIQRTNGDSKCSGKRSWHSGRTKYGRRRTYRRASCCGTASNSISARSARRRSR
ncbi:hypothetical protein BVI434_1480016 [Burkholderia vietnamiensis]|nr:hypothetical protein BVI434_1480016 [Burkholderia vietnamiensis]